TAELSGGPLLATRPPGGNESPASSLMFFVLFPGGIMSRSLSARWLAAVLLGTLAVLLWLPGAARSEPAPDLHILLVIATNAAKRGGSDEVLRPAMKANLQNIRAVLDEIVTNEPEKFRGRIFLKLLADDDLTPTNVKDALQGAKVTASSSFVFYYCGHGATDR